MAVFLWSETFRRRSYGAGHPLAFPRVPLTFDLLHSYGAFRDGEVVAAHAASQEELAAFHDPAYLSAYAACEAAGTVSAEARRRHALGTLENPWFEGFFTIPATAAGASLQAAEAVLAGAVAFTPSGGMHHARADRAQGFCFLNDTVLAIRRLREAGLRVLYVDIDAHHGDGVEAACADDPGVCTLSLHMDPRRAYPHGGGGLDDQGSDANGFACVNVPLPDGVHDAEYALLFDTVYAALIERFAPDAVVLQAGADALRFDPLARLHLTTRGWLAVVERVIALAPRHADGTPRLMATGGGGYHPLATARAWAGLWALLSGRPLPAAIPMQGAARMHALGWDLDEDQPWFAGLFAARLEADEAPAPVRHEILELRARLASHPLLATAATCRSAA